MEILHMYVRILNLKDIKKFSQMFADKLLKNWDYLKGSSSHPVDIRKAVDLIRSAEMLLHNVHGDSKCLVFWYCNVLNSPSIQLKLKENC